MAFVSRFVLYLLTAGVMVGICGCGSGSVINVTGAVTFDGQPLQEGRILFRQAEGEKRAYSASITNGRYVLLCPPGKMRVEITAYRIVPNKFDYSNGKPEPVRMMFIPPQYNSRSTLTADVSASARDFPFDLKPNG